MPPKTLRRIRFLVLVSIVGGLLLGAGGCYYVQAIRGHADLMSRRVPIDEVIGDPASPDELKRQLELVSAARAFAVSELLLPDNDSYRTYADLERDFVVWNVFAAPEFSLAPKTWCYPVAGCVAYRGYFHEDDARDLGRRLEDDGFDVAIGGVAAYSTLGRFDDPLLNTMMRWTDADLVATMFHELAHQKLYVSGDSAFNESFATAVADEGLTRWLARNGRPEALDAYLRRRELRRAVFARVESARIDLSALYESDVSVDDMREAKRRILDRLSADAGRLIEDSGSDAGNWLAAPLNNARLVSMNLYEGHVRAFRSILVECGGEFSCFYERSNALAKRDHDDRRAVLESMSVSP